MLGEALVDAMDSLRTAWDATTRKTTRAQLEAPDACAEGPASVVDACAQGLARIAAHNQVFESAAGAQGALSKQDLTLTIARVASVAVDPAAPEVSCVLESVAGGKRGEIDRVASEKRVALRDRSLIDRFPRPLAGRAADAPAVPPGGGAVLGCQPRRRRVRRHPRVPPRLLPGTGAPQLRPHARQDDGRRPDAASLWRVRPRQCSSGARGALREVPCHGLCTSRGAPCCRSSTCVRVVL